MNFEKPVNNESTVTGPAEKVLQSTVRTILKVHLLVNVLLVTTVSLLHPYSRHDIHWSQSVLSKIAAQHQVFLEALLLAGPAWLVGALIARRAPRTGVVVGVLLLATVPVVYGLEVLSWLTLGTHFFSATTFEMIASFLPWVSVYTTQTDFLPMITAVAAFLAVQAASVFAGCWLARRRLKNAEPTAPAAGGKPASDAGSPLKNVAVRRKPSGLDASSHAKPGGLRRSATCDWLFQWAASAYGSRRRAFKFGAAVVLVLLPLGWRLRHPQEILASILKAPDRHPIAATGWFVRGSSLDLEFLEPQQIRVATHLIKYEPALKRFDEEYRRLKITAPPMRQPDVLVILAESLRHNALNEKSAPNLTKFAARSLTSRLHFSAGNASEFGFFGMYYGLDPLFAPHAMRNLQSAMPQLMSQAGYFTAFLGFGELDMHLIDKFVHEDAFDHFSSRSLEPFYRRDEEVVAETQALLARKGQWAHLKDRPIFATLFLFTTHSEHHYTPEDEVFLPSPRDGLPTPPWSPATRKSALNRYHNSVHCLDRILAPLLTDDRVIVFVGDHGESFGEDERMFHGTALSFTQTRTPLILHVPGEAAKTLAGPTSHEDILPTLLDVLGTELNTPDILTGRSLLAEPDRNDEVFSLRATITGEHALLDFRQGQPGTERRPIFRFKIDPWKPRFRLRDANDSRQQPLTFSAAQAGQFESVLRDWLDRRLRIDSGPISDEPLPLLIGFLETGSETEVLRALAVLNELGPAAKPALSAISKHLTSEHPKIRRQTQALLRILATVE
jgi:hypothetical protein